ncbi:MAG TPA: penicillin-binding protein activator LpoB, partial [Deferrisomatales bacterium]|nr:penicillin-binding protein activator LpoB [Deferrisomatales bacterium]
MTHLGRAGQVLLVAVGVALAAGCATKVTRMDAAEVKDLSGAWNDTDSRLVSQEMIGDMLEQAWITNHRAATGGRPTVIVGEMKNLSHEHINLSTFIADIERSMINSGQVEFVASQGERVEIRGERKDQDLHAREDTRKAMGQEIGADYMLKGSINTIIDAADKDQVRYYQVDLSLISLTDNR